MADSYISENDTINYNNYDYTDSPEGSNQPCSSQSSNDLGAQLSVLYYLMFIFSLVGNSLVLVIIHRFERLTTVTNILLLNLVISSLIFISSLPFIAAYLKLKKWIFGSAMCKIMGSVYYLGLYTSVLFLTLLTFDRHLAVVYPLNASHIRNRKYAFFSCAVVWIVSAVACIIPMITHNTVNSVGTTLCEQDYGNIPSAIGMKLRTTWFYLQLIMFLIFPVIVILYCYFRIAITVMSSKIVSKFKTVRLILVIVLLFFMSWAPFSILELMEDGTTNCVQKQRIEYGIVVSRNLAYFYFCISPFFYTFVGRKFQNYFRQLLVKRFPALKKYISVNEVSRTNLSTKSTKRSLRE
ncbi:C-C chemokine receptor type 3-like isoform X2 [Oryzias latipes]|uniref:G-protein coupled receptors family 1 profile domain-containing protein n=1 Tax=Oryzias latipes TaxID=8090 RepID=H2LBR6_ORYLA